MNFSAYLHTHTSFSVNVFSITSVYQNILIPDRRAIVAFPGSGSRWIRSMIATGTGIIIERGKGRYDNDFEKRYNVLNETECKKIFVKKKYKLL